MNFSDRVAQIVERVRDTEAEAVHGPGSDVISDDAWFADCADFILPDSLKESKELRYQISQAMYWLEPDRTLPTSDLALYAVEHMTKVGQIIINTALRNGMTAKQLGGDV